MRVLQLSSLRKCLYPAMSTSWTGMKILLLMLLGRFLCYSNWISSWLLNWVLKRIMRFLTGWQGFLRLSLRRICWTCKLKNLKKRKQWNKTSLSLRRWHSRLITCWTVTSSLLLKLDMWLNWWLTLSVTPLLFYRRKMVLLRSSSLTLRPRLTLRLLLVRI